MSAIPEWDQYATAAGASSRKIEKVNTMNKKEKAALAERLELLPPDDLFREEAARLANLSVRERNAALAVHQRIADDTRLSQATRDHARFVAETLEGLVKDIQKARR